jgi:hypothetical protein
MAKRKKSLKRARQRAGGVHGTASARRRLVIECLDRELDLGSSTSNASLFKKLVHDSSSPLQIVTSGDVDGLVSTAMLCSVLPAWKVAAVIFDSQEIWVAPSIEERPENLFGVDVFSLQFHSVSNHIQYYGDKKLRQPEKLRAFQDWDVAVQRESQRRVFANPNVWAKIQACYEDADRPRSAKYKYPLGTAQVLLALMEVCGIPPKFYDRRFLPWLVANCDGGIRTYANHGYNADIWWPTLAAAVGPGSLSESLYLRVSQMRPQDFRFEVNSLAREFHSSTTHLFFDDQWRLTGSFPKVWMQALAWLLDLTGWHDPILGGWSSLEAWQKLPVTQSERISLKTVTTTDKGDARAINDAHAALNANFYIGGMVKEGSRFNWIAGW